MHADFLENRGRRGVRAGPPDGAARQLVGALVAGGADQHAAPVREDDQRVDVRGGDAVCRADGGDQHLLDVQAHFAEAAAQRAQVLPGHVRPEPGEARLPLQAREHGGDRVAGPAGLRGRSRCELVPV